MSTTDCPLNEAGHRYFIYKTFEVYEPLYSDTYAMQDSPAQLYEKVEYAVMGCNCSATVKRKIKNGDTGD